MKTTKVLVCGGRDYTDRDKVYSVLDKLCSEHEITIIHGNARGADTLASDYAIEHNIPELAFPADWGTYGRSAGYFRNLQMLEEGEPDLVIAFPGGNGTRMMIELAKKVKVETWIIE